MEGQEDLTVRMKKYTDFLDEKLKSNCDRIHEHCKMLGEYKGSADALELSLIIGSLSCEARYSEAYIEARAYFYEIFSELKSQEEIRE